MKSDRPVSQTELAKSGAKRRMDQQGCGPTGRRAGSHLLELVSDGLGLLVPLEPHHILGVEPPRLLLQGLGRKVLCLSALRGRVEWGLGGTQIGRGKGDSVGHQG